MGKHTLEKKTNKVLVIVAILIILAVIIGIVVFFIGNNKTPEEKLKETIDSCFTSLKSSNIEKANKYINYDELVSSFDELIIENSEEEISNIEKELFKSIEWDIENIEIENDKATAVIEVTNKNFKDVITKWMEQMYTVQESKQNISDEIALRELEEVLINENETKTEIKRITLNQNDENWKIEVNESLRDLMYPGIDIVFSILNQY